MKGGCTVNSEALIAFSVGDSDVSIGEVIRAAFFRGELKACASGLMWELACEAQAAEEGLEEDEAAVGAMVDQFRYEHDLESAEEAEAWLDARGLSAEDFQAYFVRSYWWKTLKERVGADGADGFEFDSDGLEALAAEALMSGLFARLAVELARRLIASGGSAPELDGGFVIGERERFFARTGVDPGALSTCLSDLDRDGTWFESMLALELGYRKRRDEVLSPEHLAQALRSARMPLSRLKIERVEFDSLDAAREAYLVATEDAMSLEDVARETRFPFECQEVFAEDLNEREQQRLFCAKPGEILAPTADAGLYIVCRLVQRDEPVLGDAVVMSRLERRVLNAHFSEMGSDTVKWSVR